LPEVLVLSVNDSLKSLDGALDGKIETLFVFDAGAEDESHLDVGHTVSVVFWVLFLEFLQG
jgi:hypothetical protein